MLDWDSTEKTENLESQEKKTEPQVSETQIMRFKFKVQFRM